MNRKAIKLDCGFEAETWAYCDLEYIRISLNGLYCGEGYFSDFSKLFNELSEKGFSNRGISLELGYYDSVDDMLIDAVRPKPKNNRK